MDALGRGMKLVDSIKSAVGEADDITCVGDASGTIVNGYVPATEYDTVLALADEYGAIEAAPYIVQGTNELHIALDIDGGE